MDTTQVYLEGVAEKAALAADASELIVEGWAARYDSPDRQQEYFMPGAFSRTWEKFKNLGAPFLYQHADGKVLGQVIDLQEKAGSNGEPGGVWMKARLPKPTSDWAVDAWNGIKDGFIKGLSAKGVFTKQLLPGGGARIRDVDLWEISATPVAVGSDAFITAVAAKALNTDPTPEEFQAVTAYFDKKFAEVTAAFDELGGRCHNSV